MTAAIKETIKGFFRWWSNVWKFSFQGEQGVSEVLKKLKDELKIAMALAGEETLNVLYLTWLSLNGNSAPSYAVNQQISTSSWPVSYATFRL